MLLLAFGIEYAGSCVCTLGPQTLVLLGELSEL